MNKEYKIVTLGEGGVGKTSLLVRYVKGTFNERQPSTVALSYFEKNIYIGRNRIKLQLYDSAGQERFRSLAPIYYRDADGVILVFSVCDHSSFKHLHRWKSELHKFCEKDVAIVVAGNKCDLQKNMVEDSELKEFNLPFYRTSAKAGKNVDELFLTLTKNIIKKRSEGGGSTKKKISPLPTSANQFRDSEKIMMRKTKLKIDDSGFGNSSNTSNTENANGGCC